MAVEVRFEAGNLQQTATPSGYKMTAKSAVDVVLVSPSTLLTSRLAPYESWEVLLDSAKENFEKLTKLLGRQKVIRIGARFINRIDIPNNMLKQYQLHDFLRLRVPLDTDLTEDTGSYSIAVNAVHRETGVKLLVQTATVNPVLLDCTSVMLDIDAFLDSQIPQRFEDMWAKTELLRVAKNSIFEASITDKARELFQ